MQSHRDTPHPPSMRQAGLPPPPAPGRSEHSAGSQEGGASARGVRPDEGALPKRAHVRPLPWALEGMQWPLSLERKNQRKPRSCHVWCSCPERCPAYGSQSPPPHTHTHPAGHTQEGWAVLSFNAPPGTSRAAPPSPPCPLRVGGTVCLDRENKTGRTPREVLTSPQGTHLGGPGHRGQKGGLRPEGLTAGFGCSAGPAVTSPGRAGTPQQEYKMTESVAVTPKKAQPRTGDGHSGTRAGPIMPLKSNCKLGNQIRSRSEAPTADGGWGWTERRRDAVPEKRARPGAGAAFPGNSFPPTQVPGWRGRGGV